MNFDYVICDSSPGLQYSSINVIVAAEIVLVVTSIDKSDIDGTQRMLQDLYDLYERKTGIVVNKVPETILSGRTHIKLDTHQLPILLIWSPVLAMCSNQEDNTFSLLKRHSILSHNRYEK